MLPHCQANLLIPNYSILFHEEENKLRIEGFWEEFHDCCGYIRYYPLAKAESRYFVYSSDSPQLARRVWVKPVPSGKLGCD